MDASISGSGHWELMIIRQWRDGFFSARTHDVHVHSASFSSNEVKSTSSKMDQTEDYRKVHRVMQ